jgi:hypothetical protein
MLTEAFSGTVRMRHDRHEQNAEREKALKARLSAFALVDTSTRLRRS